MQTFMPFPSFVRSARALDDKRLGKQRVEAFQVLRVLVGVKSGWGDHPMTRMWRGYEGALTSYGMAVCNEWRRRGFADTVENKLHATLLARVDVKDMPLDELLALIDARNDVETPEGAFRTHLPWTNTMTVRELKDAGMLPWWMGWRPLHRSHRANLVRKDVAFYLPQFESIDPDIREVADSVEYLWPDASSRGSYTIGDSRG